MQADESGPLQPQKASGVLSKHTHLYRYVNWGSNAASCQPQASLSRRKAVLDKKAVEITRKDSCEVTEKCYSPSQHEVFCLQVGFKVITEVGHTLLGGTISVNELEPMSATKFQSGTWSAQLESLEVRSQRFVLFSAHSVAINCCCCDVMCFQGVTGDAKKRLRALMEKAGELGEACRVQIGVIVIGTDTVLTGGNMPREGFLVRLGLSCAFV